LGINQILRSIESLSNKVNDIISLADKIKSENDINNENKCNLKSLDEQYYDDVFNILTRPQNWYFDLIIYDVGMHDGEDTEFYLKKGFKVVAIEANPQLCVIAENRLKHYIDSGRLKILNCGIHEKDGGSLSFYINKRMSEWSSFIKEVAGRIGDELIEISIPCRTLKSIIAEHGHPYYVKIDIEGHDEIALKSMLELNNPIPYVSVENGSTMIKDLFNSGYDRFKYIQQQNISKSKLPYPSLEGNFIEYTFKRGSSGPFGEETSGGWENYYKTFVKVSTVWNIETGEKNPRWDDLKDGWFDLHAKHSKYDELLASLIQKTKNYVVGQISGPNGNLFPIYNTDIFLVSYPHSGNTWIRTIIANVKAGSSEITYKNIQESVIDYYKEPFLLYNNYENRIIKSHEFYCKDYPKVIYIYRDGRDVLSSYYYFYKQFYNFDDSFKHFIISAIEGNVAYGSWAEHIRSWMKNKVSYPVLYVKYEDLISNFETTTNKILEFTGLSKINNDYKKIFYQSSKDLQNRLFINHHYENSKSTTEENLIKNISKKNWNDLADREINDLFWNKFGETMEFLGYENNK
jgi:FkbM family methyltransferase